jgi:uncharacterized protein YuzE
MKVHFDEKADALYVRLDDSKITESQEVQPGNFNQENQVMGLRFLE